MKKLFVGKLAFATTEDQLRGLFEEFGPVASCKIITDKMSGRSRGFGFVELEDDQKANDAINALNGQSVDGFEIVVSEARDDQRRDRPRSGGFGGGGGGGGGFRGGDRGGDRGRSGGGDRGGRGGSGGRSGGGDRGGRGGGNW